MLGLSVLRRYENTKSGYIKLYLSNKKVVEEHRYVMANHLGRELEKDEVVHHIDENKKNNGIENLLLKKKKIHASEHRLKQDRKIATSVKLTCSFCKGEFYKKDYDYYYAINKGQTDFYCDCSCMASHYGRGRSKS